MRHIRAEMGTRLCNHCKKPMFNSWCGEWVGKEFLEIHSKCKEAWKASQKDENQHVKSEGMDVPTNVDTLD